MALQGVTIGEQPGAPVASARMPHETRLERRLDNAVSRATTPRGAAAVIGITTVAITAGSGLLMTVLDRDNYPSIGSGLWWAIQTTTTVGYGDHVPTTVAGQLVAAVVMVFGIGFLTVITAAITSTFVARSHREQKDSGETPTVEQVLQLDARLERIETALSGASHLEQSSAGAETPTAEQLRQLDARLERIEAALTRPS